MNEGFFSSTQLKSFEKRKSLPPVLPVRLPPAPAAKPKPKYQFDPKNPQQIMDIECYPNYFLIKFLRLEDNYVLSFELTEENSSFDNHKRVMLKMILDRFEIITFNGNNFDVPILKLAMKGATCKELKEATNLLINGNTPVWKFEKDRDLPRTKFKHIDMIELIKGILSLKLYSGRIHFRKLQDLPYPEDAILTEEQMDEIDAYCEDDLFRTRAVYEEILPRIELRRVMSEQYDLDLMSKSDAQIAEAVIKSEFFRMTGNEIERPDIHSRSFLYEVPDFIQFDSSALNRVLDIVTTKEFKVNSGGIITPPEELQKDGILVKMGQSAYTVKYGGLHSTEKTAFHISDDKYSIWDWDVTSYYPAIILRCGLCPEQMGRVFIKIYNKIVEERVEAKRNKDKVKADVLKIVVNGSFGKFGSAYSALYAPDLLIQVTITGQLSLLMLIEMMEAKGISVVSGNTDGIVLKCPKDKEGLMKRIISIWEHKTGFQMESAKYAGIFSRDVNNYIAIKEDGDVKTKGCFGTPGIDDKNPENEICSIAMIEYIKYGTPFEDTVRGCNDITKFLTLRSVNGGAVKDGKYLGKAIRWFHARGEEGTINYQTNGNQVAMTKGVKPLMDLNVPFPRDVDYNWYIDHCKELF